MPIFQFTGVQFSEEHTRAFLDFLKHWKMDEVFFTLDKDEKIDIAFIPRKDPVEFQFVANPQIEPAYMLPDGSAYVGLDAIGFRQVLDGSEEIAITSMSGYLYRSGVQEDPEKTRRFVCRKRRKKILKIW